MGSSITAEEWERRKNAIHTLYILDDLPMVGSSGVIEMMKQRYGFCARQASYLIPDRAGSLPTYLRYPSKRQYEYRMQKWGFEKNMPGDNYSILASKLGKRKREGIESNVFWRGKLVPAAKLRKESLRHGYMTTLEKLYRAQGNVQRRLSLLFHFS